jgi:LysM repeat protein
VFCFFRIRLGSYREVTVMKRKMTSMGVVLLILALIAVGLGACSRSAQEREAQTPEAVGTPVGSSPSGGESAPAPGETVVSAVTPVAGSPGAETQQTPVAGAQPTAGASDGTPVDSQPTQPPAPTATAAPPSSSTGGEIWHTVQRGETTYSIARRYGTTVNAIAQANNMVNPSQIVVGQRLKIPTSGSSSSGSSGSSGGTTGCRAQHTVKRGEWVWQIARNYGVSPYDILAANGMSVATGSTIYAGTVLCIP